MATMRLCSIINAWADTLELLPFCIENHLQFCDGVIVIWSQYSNHGVSDEGVMLNFIASKSYANVIFHQLEPIKGQGLLVNETRKRNQGLEVAKEEKYTHFIIADADEFYIPEEVNRDKKLFDEPSLNGLVCGLHVYISKPTLWCEDHTLLPFIHRLQKKTYCGNFPEYPFAYDEKGDAHIDPSRRINEIYGIIKSDTIMRHFSYVRKDIDLKINNSTANLRRSEIGIKRDIKEAKPGYVVSFNYHQALKESPNYFGIHI